MANKSRFSIAETSIKTFFKQNNKRVFSREELTKLFEDHKAGWNLPLYLNATKFIDQLINKEILKSILIEFDSYRSNKQRFLVNDASVFHIAASLANRGYISHYSAVFLNGLTNQVPKVIYVTFEQSKKASIKSSLTQEAIDQAFSKPQRKSLASANYGDYSFLMLNGMFTNHSGIYMLEGIPVTNIERTLIDITVRPSYAGGVFSVLEAYQRALASKLVSINKLIATLDNMNFIYPYHQAVGFYLDKAGYQGKKLEEIKSKNSNFDFYLSYEIEEKQYSKHWKIYYPTGM